MDKFWKTYRTISLYLIFPAICMFVVGMFSQLLDPDPERFDRQTQGVVVSCVDKTDRSRATAGKRRIHAGISDQGGVSGGRRYLHLQGDRGLPQKGRL